LEEGEGVEEATRFWSFPVDFRVPKGLLMVAKGGRDQGAPNTTHDKSKAFSKTRKFLPSLPKETEPDIKIKQMSV
jgi:hypothetical protein